MKFRTKEARDTFKKIFGDQLDVAVYQNKEVLSCSHCSGTGWTSREELTDYHKREYSTFNDQCKFCKGDGRITRTNEIVRISPYYSHHINSQEFKIHSDVPFSEDPLEKPNVSVFNTYEKVLIDEKLRN